MRKLARNGCLAWGSWTMRRIALRKARRWLWGTVRYSRRNWRYSSCLRLDLRLAHTQTPHPVMCRVVGGMRATVASLLFHRPGKEHLFRCASSLVADLLHQRVLLVAQFEDVTHCVASHSWEGRRACSVSLGFSS